MKFLILGGNGFIGSHLCERLIKDGHNLRVLCRNQGFTKNLDYLDKEVEWISGDFQEINDFNDLLNGIDMVFHLISTTIPHSSNLDPIYDLKSNLLPTVLFLEAAAKRKIKKIIYFSSGGTVYGDPNSLPIKEDHPTNPITSYGIHKLTIEKYLKVYKENYGLDYIILRIANPYGLGQLYSSKVNHGIIGTFIKNISNNVNLTIWGDGEVVRDFIYINDLVEAIIHAADYHGDNKIFNIGSGKGLTVNQVISILFEVMNKKVPVEYLAARNFDIRENTLDIKMANNFLNWKPRYSFEQGLKDLLDIKSKGEHL